ncbi:MAG: L-2-amino-thiazoline-4-carboxylic acid hydrolase [Spirochaetes bacterium]|nr:L-2-amino-thiazoline-4-carboxylic acid hydrolase [Spirochaetota bacterium]
MRQSKNIHRLEEISDYDLLFKSSISRRSCLKLGAAAVGLFGCYSLLSGCNDKKAHEPAIIPPENPELLSNQARQYYTDRENELMDDFDMIAGWVKEYLTTRYDASKIDTWLSQSRIQYKQLIPELPYIGGDKNALNQILLLTSAYIPIVKVLKNEGISTRENGQMIVMTTSKGYEEKIPWFVKWYLKWNYFSDSGKRKKKAAALLSQKKTYPDDWVFTYVKGDGSTFDYGITYSECALKKFWISQNLKEYVPYLCLCDYAIWKAIGIEVKRTKTLGNGATECDFRYIKKGSGVPPAWPPESHQEWTGRYES